MARLGLAVPLVLVSVSLPTFAQDWLFEEVTESHLPLEDTRPSSRHMLTMDAHPIDVEGDGDLDLPLSNQPCGETDPETTKFKSYINDGTGTFTYNCRG